MSAIVKSSRTPLGTRVKQKAEQLKSYRFLFEELVKRDFKKKYKRTALGMVWSVLSPLLNVLVLWMVFVHLFGRTQPHFIIYLFSGTLVMNFYSESTRGGMKALVMNASIFTKINIPKSLFLFSKMVQSFINFGLTFIIYIIFCLIDHIHFGPHVLMLFYPIITMSIFNLGVSMTLSSLFIFFKDVEYLYSIFLLLLNYVSAIFYPVSIVGEKYQRLFYLNPVYSYIKYFRLVMIDGMVPSWIIHGLCLLFALIMLGIGMLVYKKFKNEFLYYV